MDAYEYLLTLPKEEMHDEELYRVVEGERRVLAHARARARSRSLGSLDRDPLADLELEVEQTAA